MCVMRVHVYLDEETLRMLDEEVGKRERSAFIEEAVKKELDQRRRWRLIWSAIESSPMTDEGHPWDPDPATYFHEERRRQTTAREQKLAKAWGDDR